MGFNALYLNAKDKGNFKLSLASMHMSSRRYEALMERGMLQSTQLKVILLFNRVLMLCHLNLSFKYDFFQLTDDVSQNPNFLEAICTRACFSNYFN